MKQYITPGVGVINTDDTCYVLAKDYKDDTGNGFKIVHKDGVNGTTSYIKGNKYQCRWIDYVGDTKKVGSTKLPDGIKEKYRMPFK